MLYCLHGTLGAPHDFSSIPFHVPFKAIDLYGKFGALSLTGFASQFNKDVMNDGLKKRVLLGYSLGGRLVLHALLDNPTLWDGAIIISASCGHQSEDNKQLLVARDLKFAKQALNKPWDEFVTNWENQEIFKTSKEKFYRRENDYKKEIIANTLVSWSVGNQRDLFDEIENLNVPILWVTGDNDKKYQMMAKSLTLRHQASSCITIKDAGHRVPWDNPLQFANVVDDFYTLLPERA